MRGSRVSYVFPIYNETGNIDLLYRTVDEVVRGLPYEIELIFVNDGSRDDSLAKLRALAADDPRVKVLDFARNYGHQIAVTAGLDASTGDAVIIMDSDLQDPPRVSIDLLAKWEEGWDVVYAQRRSRKDTPFKKATAAAFYKGLRYMSEVDIPANTGDFRLLDRRVVDELSKYKERDRFLRGMVSFIGFDQTAVQFDRDERHSGESGYPLGKMITFATDGIMGFSTFPLKIISRIGFVAAAFSVVGIVYVLVMKLFVPQVVVAGWAFIVLSILLMGGLQLIMLGILGGYVGRIYRQVQQRPLYALRDERPSPVALVTPIAAAASAPQATSVAPVGTPASADDRTAATQ
ncbi:glycosyltransferase family 2 protein [Frondihabitans australicus]|uniref:Dolichol-phosphate mannosyltransferase n=1 Tax=Frondihabitans australicus TaxID=386892 RepID=A0A495IA96_9MICO|nr:glycosyltransferase family 2 protein [Frondihabitans australicus]RKR72943.1 dolichol-phosphate mannosyltransferase [Frondihabitans australicus]